MKSGEYKIIANVNRGKIHLAYKSKNGLLFTVTDTKYNTIVESGFNFYLGKDFTQLLLHRDNKGLYLELIIPTKEEKIRIKLVDRDAYKKFLETDYNGYILK